MTLILLFLLVTPCLFVDAGPITLVGIFFIICYMPGLSLFLFLKRGSLLFQDMVLSFPASIGLSGILTILLLLCGLDINYVPAIIHFISVIVLVIAAINRRSQFNSAEIRITSNEIRFGFASLLITVVLSIPLYLGPDHITIANHVFHHSSLVTQIINGIFPPENPGLGGTAIGYYWGFHALIAALAVRTNYQQIQIIFVLNSISLYMIFCIAYSFAKSFDMSEVYCYIMSLAVIGLMRFDAGLLCIYKLVTGNLVSVDEIKVSLLHPSDILMAWLNGLSWLDTRMLFIRKFYNVSGMPLAISLCFAYLLILRLLLEKNHNENNRHVITLSIVVGACFLNYPPLAIFVLIHAPLWSLYIFLSERGSFRIRAGKFMEIALPFIVAMLIVIPYMLFIVKSRGISSSGQGSLFLLDFYHQSLRNIAVFIVPLPLIISGAWFAFKRFSFSRDFFYLFIGTVLCLGLTVFTRWPFDNSYKFTYIQTFFFAVFFVLALSKLLHLLTSQWLKRLILTMIVILLAFTPLIIMAAHILAALHTEFRYDFSGKHFIYAQDKLKNEAYEWIRKNTSPDALMMLSYVETPWPCCGLNNNYEVAAISERNLFVIKDTDYTTSNPEYEKRLKYREKLFETPEDPDVVNFYNSLGREVYLLVENNLSGRFLVEKRFRDFSGDPGQPFVQVFRNDQQKVYKLITNIK